MPCSQVDFCYFEPQRRNPEKKKNQTCHRKVWKTELDMWHTNMLKRCKEMQRARPVFRQCGPVTLNAGSGITQITRDHLCLSIRRHCVRSLRSRSALHLVQAIKLGSKLKASIALSRGSLHFLQWLVVWLGRRCVLIDQKRNGRVSSFLYAPSCFAMRNWAAG